MIFLKKSIKIFSPVTGQIKLITDVEDQVFSSKVMGDGFAVQPQSNTIYSPIVGEVTSIFPTKHAIGFKINGLEILLHIGINTVDLNGEGFCVDVKEGDFVDNATKIGTVNFDFIESKGLSTDVIVLVTNLDKRRLEVINTKSKYVQSQDEIAIIK